jgi:hypothetical protein
MASLGHKGEVRRERTSVGGACSLFVRVRRRHVIRELSRPLEHLALIIRAVSVLDLLSHRPRLVGGVGDADEVTPGDAVERVARGADLAVDLVAATDAARAHVRAQSVIAPTGTDLAWSNEFSQPL